MKKLHKWFISQRECLKKSFRKFRLKLAELRPKPIFQYPNIAKSDYGKISKSLSSAIFNRNFTKIYFRDFLWLNMPEKKFGKVSVEVGRAPSKTNFWVSYYRKNHVLKNFKVTFCSYLPPDFDV